MILKPVKGGYLECIILIGIKDYAIARSIIEMAKAMNISSIAEGVETETQQILLKGLRCNEAQGYLFSQPLPFDQFVEFTQANHDTSMNFSK